MFTGNGSLTPICSLSNRSLAPILNVSFRKILSTWCLHSTGIHSYEFQILIRKYSYFRHLYIQWWKVSNLAMLLSDFLLEAETSQTKRMYACNWPTLKFTCIKPQQSPVSYAINLTSNSIEKARLDCKKSHLLCYKIPWMGYTILKWYSLTAPPPQSESTCCFLPSPVPNYLTIRW